MFSASQRLAAHQSGEAAKPEGAEKEGRLQAMLTQPLARVVLTASRGL
jgi:hypothetical protein